MIGRVVSNKFGQIFRVLEVKHISCNTGTCALPDMSTFALRRSGVMRKYQAMHSCLVKPFPFPADCVPTKLH